MYHQNIIEVDNNHVTIKEEVLKDPEGWNMSSGEIALIRSTEEVAVRDENSALAVTYFVFCYS